MDQHGSAAINLEQHFELMFTSALMRPLQMKHKFGKRPDFCLYLLLLLLLLVEVAVVVAAVEVEVIQGSPQTQSLLSDAFITVVFSQH